MLAGGLSLERDVSLRSGGRVADALADRGYDVQLLDVDSQLLAHLGAADAAFLALHGKTGEDGTIQGILEVLGIPYTGPDAVSSAMAWDKHVAKGFLARAGLSTPDWVAVSAGAVRDIGGGALQERLLERLGLPLVVKPSQGGAFMGVRFVTTPAEFPEALLTAFSYHDVVLVERLVTGTEVAVSLLDGETLPPVEIVPKDGSYDYAARYTPGVAEFYAPARLEPSTLLACQQAAARAWDVFNCRDITRVDMIVDEHGAPWILELDTCPGLTETSLLPMAAAEAGRDFADVCEQLVRALAGRAVKTTS